MPKSTAQLIKESEDKHQLAHDELNEKLQQLLLKKDAINEIHNNISNLSKDVKAIKEHLNKLDNVLLHTRDGVDVKVVDSIKRIDKLEALVSRIGIGVWTIGSTLLISWILYYVFGQI